MSTSSASGWRGTLAAYRGPLMPQVFLLGVISGFPWVLIGSLLTLWLQEAGFSRGQVGLFGAVFMVYAINLLWAPLVDAVPPPLLRRFGQRRGWIALMQLLIFILVLALSVLDPVSHLWLMAATALGIATASATQDVAIDALRIELVGSNEPQRLASGAAMAVSGWWGGYGLLGGLLLGLAAQLAQNMMTGEYWLWCYWAAAGIGALLTLVMLRWVPEPERHSAVATSDNDVLSPAATVDSGGVTAVAPPSTADSIAGRIVLGYVAPLRAFLSHHGTRLALILLLVVFAFKIGEAMLGRMSLLFYTEIGFSKGDIALYSKGFGSISYCVFAIVGSLISVRYGLFRGLLLSGIAMAATNLLFALLAWRPEGWLFGVAVITDQLTTAVSTVAFVAFLSSLCQRGHTATQYAALASLGNLSRTTLAVGSGFIVDGLGGDWPLFFLLTALMVLPSLALLLWQRAPIQRALRAAAAP